MGILDELARLSSAEDFFACLDVPYDGTVLQVARLHILRRMGQYLRAGEGDGLFLNLDEAAIRSLCQGYLHQAYQDFVTSTPVAERLFKVHQDAVAPKAAAKKAFVPLSVLTPDR